MQRLRCLITSAHYTARHITNRLGAIHGTFQNTLSFFVIRVILMHEFAPEVTK